MTRRNNNRVVAQLGSARRSGRRGRRFESCLSDGQTRCEWAGYFHFSKWTCRFDSGVGRAASPFPALIGFTGLFFLTAGCDATEILPGSIPGLHTGEPGRQTYWHAYASSIRFTGRHTQG